MKNFWSRQFLVLAMVASSFSLALPAVAADERWALLVGVDKCANLGELKVCAADARSLQAVLEQAGYQGQVKVLADDGPDLSQWPTQSNLERAIENLAKTADAGDTILLFFSGHGLTRNGEGYLVPSDGDQKRGLALAWVKDQLRASKAREKILILDACHAGTAKGVTGIVPDATASKDLVMLLSCDRDQVSWPDEAGGHSVFTAALIAGLAGQAVVGPDRRVTAAALHRYVQGRVKQWVFTNGRESQTPLLVADATGDVVLAELAMANPAAVTRNVTPLTTATATSNVTPPPTNGKPGDLWTNRIGMKLAYLPAGEFVMGSAANEEHPVGAETPHPVKISNPFLIGVTEVTQEQWKAIMGNCPSKFKGRDDLPVENVSWHEAVEFCKKLSANSGLAYRLPTEAEWEYACRAGTTGPYAGTEELDSMGWHAGNSGGATRPVGQQSPNAWGLYDLHGNVWEWCADWYVPYPTDLVTGSAGSKWGTLRVLRGGSWFCAAALCRSAYRCGFGPGYRSSILGFRVALSVTPGVGER